jgi:hypothetical protein
VEPCFLDHKRFSDFANEATGIRELFKKTKTITALKNGTTKILNLQKSHLIIF